MTEAPILCVCCPVLRPAGKPRRPNTPMVCDGCREKLAALLAEIPPAYARLPDFLEPGQMAGERRTNGFESRPPLNIAALSLLSDGSDTPKHRLDFWAQEWAEPRRETPPCPAVSLLVPWLADRLDWACGEFFAVDEFAWDVYDICGQLRAFRPRENGESAGRCPRKPGDARCNTPLSVDPYNDTIKCERCGASWNRRDGQWLHLRGQQIAAGVEAA